MMERGVSNLFDCILNVYKTKCTLAGHNVVAQYTFHFCFVRYLILTLIFEVGTRSYTRREMHNVLASVLCAIRFFYFVLSILSNFFSHHSIIIIIQQTNTSIRETSYLGKYLEQVMIYCRINVFTKW